MVGRVGAVHVAGWLVASVVLEGSLMCDRERWQLLCIVTATTMGLSCVTDHIHPHHDVEETR
jgi:hypothetical protein